jgi:phage shock protein A
MQKAETEIRTTLSGLDQSSALVNFERMEDKVEQQEARASALGELSSNSVEDRFEALETGYKVGHELAALKAKKALSPTAEYCRREMGCPTETTAWFRHDLSSM